MKILIQTLGTRGDVDPLITLGRRLKRSGHDVVIATSQFYRDDIESAGLRANCSTVDSISVLNLRDAADSVRNPLKWLAIWRKFMALMHRQQAELWRAGEEERADVIVYNPFAFTAPDIARATGARAVPVFAQPAFAPTGAFANPLLTTRKLGRLGNRVNHVLFLTIVRIALWGLRLSFRRATGLPVNPWADPFRGHRAEGRRLHAYSPALMPDDLGYGPDEIVTGAFVRKLHEWTPPPRLKAFLDAGPPPVYIGFGSMPKLKPEDLADAILEALRKTGQRGIVATRWRGFQKYAAGHDVLVIEKAPHHLLFQLCAAVVHHGGAGTTHAGLMAGRPTVICPLMVDQPFWGLRVAALGVGPDPIPQRALTADRLTSALEVALSAPVRRRATELGAVLSAEDGCARAIEENEGLALSE